MTKIRIVFPTRLINGDDFLQEVRYDWIVELASFII
jgi:hypothetical protein